MKSIIIDAGHGGNDSGAIGFGVLEKDWNLKISLYQYRRLKELGAKVGLTRTKDETLESFNRVSRIKNQYDYCISNHWNAFNSQARGVETIHSYLANPKFATNLARQIVKDSGLPLRRVFSRKTSNNRSDYYFMHRLTGSTKTVIIEYGFIDHARDHAFYSNDHHFYKVAEGVVKVICQHIGVKYKAPEYYQSLQPKAQTKELYGNTEENVSQNNAEANKSKSNVTRDKTKINVTQNKSKPNVSQDIVKPNALQGASVQSKQLVSIYPGKLRFYNKPSWNDADIFGYLTKGVGFPKVIRKVKVGSAYQYEVKNSKGQTFYVTASPQFVKLISK